MPLANGGIAHVAVNWLSPTKVRTMHVGGSRRMLVWDDMNPAQRLTVHDRGVELSGPMNVEARRETLISYRIGDMVAPALPESEALGGVIREIRRRPRGPARRHERRVGPVGPPGSPCRRAEPRPGWRPDRPAGLTGHNRHTAPRSNRDSAEEAS